MQLDSKEVSKPFDSGITMDFAVEENNDDQIDDQVNQQNDHKEEPDEIFKYKTFI